MSAARVRRARRTEMDMPALAPGERWLELDFEDSLFGGMVGAAVSGRELDCVEVVIVDESVLEGIELPLLVGKVDSKLEVVLEVVLDVVEEEDGIAVLLLSAEDCDSESVDVELVADVTGGTFGVDTASEVWTMIGCAHINVGRGIPGKPKIGIAMLGKVM